VPTNFRPYLRQILTDFKQVFHRHTLWIIRNNVIVMLGSRCRSDQLDGPDRPGHRDQAQSNLTQLHDRALYTTCFHARPIHDLCTTPPRLQPDNQPDLYSIIPTSTRSLYDLYSTLTRFLPDRSSTLTSILDRYSVSVHGIIVACFVGLLLLVFLTFIFHKVV